MRSDFLETRNGLVCSTVASSIISWFSADVVASVVVSRSGPLVIWVYLPFFCLLGRVKGDRSITCDPSPG